MSNKQAVRKYLWSWKSLRYDLLIFGLGIIPLILFPDYFFIPDNPNHVIGWVIGMLIALGIKESLEDRWIKSHL